MNSFLNIFNGGKVREESHSQGNDWSCLTRKMDQVVTDKLLSSGLTVGTIWRE
jgi:hypothetical protein